MAALAGREETDVLWGMRSHVRSSTRGLDLVKEDVNAGMVCRMYTGIVRQDGCGG